MHIHRKLGTSRAIKIAAAIVIPLTSLGVFAATGGLASASSPRAAVTFKGDISCSLTGTVTISPGITLTKATAAGSATATFKGKNVDCTGTHGTKLTQSGETIKSSTEDFTFKITWAKGSSGCGGLVSGVSPAITGATVNWVATSPVTATKISFKAGTISTAGLVTYGSGTATGSFAGTAKVQLQSSMVSSSLGNKPYTAANAAAACKAKGGLTDITFVQPKPSTTYPKNDNEEIGPAY